jgi:predicted MFS family arabinose efflux permease
MPNRTVERAYFGLILLGIGLCGVSLVALAALGATIERELHLGHTQLGLLAGGVFAGQAAASVGFSSYVRRWSLRSFGLGSLALLVAGNLLATLPHFASLLTGRFLLGAANAGIVLFASALATHAPEERQSALINLVHSAIAAGSCVGMFVTLPLAAWLGHWTRVPFLLAAALGLVTLAAAAFPRSVCEGGSAGGWSLRAWPALLRRPAVANAALVVAAYMLIEGAVILFYPLYAQQRLARSADTAAVLVGLFIAGIVAGRLVVAALHRGKGTVRLAALLVVGGGLLLAGAVLPWTAAASVPLLLAGGLAAGPVAPMTLAMTVRRVPEARHDVLGLAALVMAVGGVAGSVLVGLWSDAFGLRAAILGSAVVFAVSAAAFGRLRRPAGDDR